MASIKKIYGYTLEQFRELSLGNRRRVVRGEPVVPEPPKERAVRIEKERAARPVPTPKKNGVGWHLKQLLEGITVEGCSCKSVAAIADRLGPDGCRERKAELAAKLGEAFAKLSAERLARVTDKLQSFGGIEGLIDESIRRAEQHIPDSGK